tara:strand:+ start:2044 stop:2349 length:306 start_codon:yes stop_codon:yes gene_type:complete
MERDLLTYPTWERYAVLSHAISNLSIGERRQVFQLTRSLEEPSGDVFFPSFGFSLSEFAVWYTLGDNRRRERKRSRGKAAAWQKKSLSPRKHSHGDDRAHG